MGLTNLLRATVHQSSHVRQTSAAAAGKGTLHLPSRLACYKQVLLVIIARSYFSQCVAHPLHQAVPLVQLNLGAISHDVEALLESTV
jgi:hypothetical protein